PLVSPAPPASATSAPAASAARACLVDGPSRSSVPLARIDSSHASRSRARFPASTSPPPATTSRASSTACSVSSVTDPAGSPAASGCPGGPGGNPPTSAPYRATTSVRGSDWAGMPSASPIASPYSAPSARDLISCITNSLPAVIPALTGPVAPAHADDHGDMAVGGQNKSETSRIGPAFMITDTFPPPKVSVIMEVAPAEQSYRHDHDSGLGVISAGPKRPPPLRQPGWPTSQTGLL